MTELEQWTIKGMMDGPRKSKAERTADIRRCFGRKTWGPRNIHLTVNGRFFFDVHDDDHDEDKFAQLVTVLGNMLVLERHGVNIMIDINSIESCILALSPCEDGCEYWNINLDY